MRCQYVCARLDGAGLTSAARFWCRSCAFFKRLYISLEVLNSLTNVKTVLKSA